MQWWNKFWKKPEETVDELSVPSTIDVMADDVDPEEVTIENAYKTRWIWYHTILALELLMVNVLLIGILVVLAVKL
jgi:hypothetical protein